MKFDQIEASLKSQRYHLLYEYLRQVKNNEALMDIQNLSLICAHQNTTSRLVSMVLHSIATRKKNKSISCQEVFDFSVFFTPLKNYAVGMGPQGIANSLWALAHLGVSWSSLDGSLTDALFNSLKSNAFGMNPQNIANSLWALAHLGVSWSSLDGWLADALLNSLQSNASGMNPQNIANSLWALAHLGVSWVSLDAPLKIALLASLQNHTNNMNSQAVTNSLWALAHLGVSWSSLDVSLKDSLLISIKSNAAEMNTQNMANSLWALAHLKVSWDSLDGSLKNALLSSLEKHAAGMNPQDIANVLWALARMHTHLTKTHINIFKAVGEIQKPLVQEELKQIIVAYYYFKIERSALVLELNVKQYEKQLCLSHNPSATQAKIIKKINGLLTDKFRLEEEQFIVGFSVDACNHDAKFVLEIDGPHHKISSQQNTDQFQNEVLAKYGYTTVRLCVLAYEKLGEEQQRKIIETIAALIKGDESALLHQGASNDVLSIIEAKSQHAAISHSIKPNPKFWSRTEGHAHVASPPQFFHPAGKDDLTSCLDVESSELNASSTEALLSSLKKSC